MALFALIPDNDASFNFLVSLLYASTFQELFYLAPTRYTAVYQCQCRFCDGRICQCFSLPDDFENLLATMRSRNISVSIIIQNIA